MNLIVKNEDGELVATDVGQALEVLELNGYSVEEVTADADSQSESVPSSSSVSQKDSQIGINDRTLTLEDVHTALYCVNGFLGLLKDSESDAYDGVKEKVTNTAEKLTDLYDDMVDAMPEDDSQKA